MPTNWLPWPGNTNAIWLISPKRMPERASATPRIRARLQESAVDPTLDRVRIDP